MQPPADFKWIAPQALKLGGECSLAARMLNAAGASEATTAEFNKSPPTGAPSRPAALHAGDPCRRLLSRRRLTTDVPHDLRKPVHRIQAVEVLLGNGLQAHASGVQDRQGVPLCRQQEQAASSIPLRPHLCRYRLRQPSSMASLRFPLLARTHDVPRGRALSVSVCEPTLRLPTAALVKLRKSAQAGEGRSCTSPCSSA